jgi:hypothetical protein
LIGATASEKCGMALMRIDHDEGYLGLIGSAIALTPVII